MTRHFLWFAAVSARNRMRLQLRRLRSPRYAVAALVGILYFVFIFGDWAAAPGEPAIGEMYMEAARSLGPLFIGLMAAWWWLWGGYRHALVLSPAETHLLVPAPITRAQLVRFRILQAQATILVSAGLATLLTRGAPLPWPLRFLSLWTLLATLHQHQIAASLVHAAASEQGRQGIRRVWLPALLFAVAFTGVAWAVWQAVGDIRAQGLGAAAGRVIELMDEPLPWLALAPFRLVMNPVVATSASEWATSFLPALLALAAHFIWVQRTDAAFEEAAASAGAERAERVSAMRAGGMARAAFVRRDRRPSAALLPLPATGPAAYAIYWKNVLYVQRLVRPLTVLLLLAGVAVVAAPAILGASSPLVMVRNTGAALLVLAALVTVGGPFAVRNDLRLDLGFLAALRTLPVPGRDVVAAEVAASATVVVIMQLAFVTVGILLLAVAGTLGPGHAVLALIAAPLLLPPLTALGVITHNALALLYPGWIRVGSQDAGGVESIGQNMVTLVGTLILLVLALVPPVLVAGAAGGALLALSRTVAAGVAGLTLAAAIAAECWLLIRWLGRLYDRTDPVMAGLIQ
ncbi:MAG TPA: hypothetical protein VK929_05565 [Longimicrobiales bacterium]|nr:hypothetical protein [Longimicrobiales bacterium]